MRLKDRGGDCDDAMDSSRNTALDNDPVVKLEPFSPATLHEASRRAQLLPRTLGPVWPRAAVRGQTYTVHQSPGNNLWIHRALYEAPPGSVLIVAVDDTEHGYWGELMARAALERGLAGIVLDGGVRDVTEMEALRFPVFASGTCLRGAVKEPDAPGSLGEPVRLGGARIVTGDIVVGGADGVVVVPRTEASEIARRAAVRETLEAEIREALSRGGRLLDLLTGPTPDRGRLIPERLRALDSCVVSDALDRLGLEGAVEGFLRWGPGVRVAGRAVTMALEPGAAPEGACRSHGSHSASSHLGTRALARAGPDDVIVVANGGLKGGGAWGGLLGLEAHVRRVAGVVVDGMLRDADEVDELSVPVLARGTTPRTARGRFHEASSGEPVEVGGVRVEPADWVLADGSGAVFVGQDHVGAVLDLAEELAAREGRMAAALRRGEPGVRVMDVSYERMLDVDPPDHQAAERDPDGGES